jgi:hypothetical protein
MLKPYYCLISCDQKCKYYLSLKDKKEGGKKGIRLEIRMKCIKESEG